MGVREICIHCIFFLFDLIRHLKAPCFCLLSVVLSVIACCSVMIALFHPLCSLIRLSSLLSVGAEYESSSQESINEKCNSEQVGVSGGQR